MEVWNPGCENDHLGQPCPVVIGSKPGNGYFAGAGYIFGEDGITVCFTDSNGVILKVQTIEKL